jgi:hypothetical protein
MNKFNDNLIEQLMSGEQAVKGSDNAIDPALSWKQYEDQADAPLFVQPSELQSAEIANVNTSPIDKSNYMDAAQQEADSQSLPMSEAEQDFNYGKGVIESGQETPESFAAKFGDRAYQPATQDITAPEQAPIAPSLTPQEKMMAEYKAMQEQDRKDLQEARSSDRNLKMGGAIGDALATYLNARGQMNVKAPGVQVQQGAGLGKIADMFATAPDMAADSKSRQENLLAQYKLLHAGEMTPYQQMALALADKRLGLQTEQEKGKGVRHGENVELRKEALYRPSDKQVEAINNYDETLSSLFRTKDLKTGIETGPIAEFRNIVASKMGVDDPRVSALRAQTVDTLAERINALSGTAASAQEVARLKGTLPSLGDSNEVFLRKLEDAETRIKEAREIRLKTLAKQGKNVEAFKEISKPASQENIKQLSTEDQQAHDWAIKNPDSEDAKAILKRLGK